MATKSTTFQKLEKALSGNWGQPETMVQPSATQTTPQDNDIIFKTTDKQEYERTKLELQQNKFLRNQWVKANVNLDVGAFSNLNFIQLMYRDADLMDAFPEIGAALDTFAEESSLPSDSTGNGNGGHIVNVYSKSDRIRAIIEDLLVNRLNLQVTAAMIIRGMCKYGNQYMMLDIDNKLGVKGWRQLPVFDVERIEHGIQNPYAQGGVAIATNTTDVIDNADAAATFIWNSQGQAQVPFRSWQIGHFRLLTNSMYLPYGVSILNSARRHFRMLSLMEDMMFIYRLERSMERRIYKIYVGAIDDADVPAYMDEIANRFKRTPIIDPLTGQIDLRKNILPVHKDTPIPLLDGRTITIEELAKEFENGKENYVYSIQDKTHKIVPGKVVWCGKNYTADKLIKITLDDDSHMILAPEHEIIMRNGSKKRADEVLPGESVMPFYRKNEPLRKKFVTEYEKVYNPNTGNYEFTHRLIAEDINKLNESAKVVHHKNFNRFDNSPSNLQWMTWKEHADYHTSINNDPKIIELRKQTSSEYWKNEEKRNRAISRMTVKFDDYVWKKIEEVVSKGDIYTQYKLIEFINDELIDYLISINSSNKLKHYRKITKPLFKARLNEFGYSNFDEYISEMEVKYNLPDHSVLKNIDKSNRAKKYNVIKNFGINWAKSNKREEVINKIIESNKARATKGIYKQIGEKNKIAFDDFVWDTLRLAVINREITKASELYNYINTNLIDYLLEHNVAKILHKAKKIDKKSVLKRINEKYGFETTNEYIESIKKNHKITKVEVVGGDDVYCMTVVGLNGEEDRHNFALSTWKSDGSVNGSGVFVSNCIDQDIFIPVRNENSPTPIDTLAAGQNLTAMDDIKFVQNKLATALRIPKAFMNFEEPAGDGKNLALMDIRFTRQVNHIQQAFLMELTKIVSIHLYLLGFSDDITNFSLTMNNPSTQAEQLELENLQKKVSVCRDAISDPGNGIPIMSQMRALKMIMKWSEKDIKENLEEIRLERAIAAELEKTTQIIKRTNVFDNVDRMYGEPGAEYVEDPQGGQGPDAGGGPGGGMGGGGGFGGGLDDLGAPGAPDEGAIGGEQGAEPTGDMAGGAPPEGGMPPEGQPMESRRKDGKVLTENGGSKLNLLFEEYINKIENNVKKKKETINRTDIFDKSLLINEEFNKMIDSLDEMITEEKKK